MEIPSAMLTKFKMVVPKKVKENYKFHRGKNTLTFAKPFELHGQAQNERRCKQYLNMFYYLHRKLKSAIIVEVRKKVNAKKLRGNCKICTFGAHFVKQTCFFHEKKGTK